MRLATSPEPSWVTLPNGVRVLAEPFDTLISQAAFAEAAAAVRPLQDAAEEARAAGTPLDPAGRTGANAAWVSAMQWVALIAATARYAIVGWEGLQGDDGAPLPVSPEACDAFARHPDLGPEWYMRYKAPGDAIDAEGNASGASSAGDGVATPKAATDVLTVPPGRSARATSSPAAAARAS